jgi:hypothetical protein
MYFVGFRAALRGKCRDDQDHRIRPSTGAKIAERIPTLPSVNLFPNRALSSGVSHNNLGRWLAHLHLRTDSLKVRCQRVDVLFLFREPALKVFFLLGNS